MVSQSIMISLAFPNLHMTCKYFPLPCHTVLTHFLIYKHFTQNIQFYSIFSAILPQISIFNAYLHTLLPSMHTVVQTITFVFASLGYCLRHYPIPHEADILPVLDKGMGG